VKVINRLKLSPVALMLAAVAFAAIPAQAATVVPTPTGTRFTVNEPGYDHTDPHVSGDLFAYTMAGSTSVIHYRNALNPGVDHIVPNTSPSLQYDFLSDIDNGKIVFSRSTLGTNGAIFLFDTSTPLVPPRALNPIVGSARDMASIGGNTVAWQDRTPGGNAQLVVYDLVTNTTVALTNDAATMTNLWPNVSPDGKVVAWLKCLPSGNHCQAWDAIQGAGGVWTSRQLTSGSMEVNRPATNGRIVVYGVGLAGVYGGAIRYQPVGGGPEQTITMPASTGVTAAAYPSISGDLVSFTGYRSTGSSSIWVADLLAGTVYQVSPVEPQFSTLSDISLAPDGTVTVVWETFESGQYNVKGFRYHWSPPDPPLTITHIGATSYNLDAAAGVTFTDADPNGNLSQYSATIDWGDHGTPTAATVVKSPFSPGFAAGGTHRYAVAGTYTISVTVNDVGGATASRSTTLAVSAARPDE
jgi:hypothetical protein